MSKEALLDLETARLNLKSAREVEQVAWENFVLAVRNARILGLSYDKIAAQVGLSKARIFKIVNNESTKSS